MTGILSWGGAAKTALIALERAQKTGLKFMGILRYNYPTIDLYTTQILRFRQIYIKTVLLFQHKIPTNNIPQHQTRYVKPYIISYTKKKKQNFANDLLGPYLCGG